jgi:hypothetical protein
MLSRRSHRAGDQRFDHHARTFLAGTALGEPVRLPEVGLAGEVEMRDTQVVVFTDAVGRHGVRCPGLPGTKG